MSDIKNNLIRFLSSHPSSSAKLIAHELGLKKSEVNSVLYGNECFSHEGSSPPLWTNYNPKLRRETNSTYIKDGGQGLPGFLGYHVGASGEFTYKRRKILDNIMTKPLPLFSSPEYMSEWGEIASSKRLNRLLIHLATQTNTRKYSKSYDQAHRDWRSDIDYLIEKYKHFDIEMPYLQPIPELD